jgi:predicted ATP-binding protein involved in virulence
LSVDASWAGISVKDALERVEALRESGRCSLWIGEDVVRWHGITTWGEQLRSIAREAGFELLSRRLDFAPFQRPVQRGDDPELESLSQVVETRPRGPVWIEGADGAGRVGVAVRDSRYRAVFTDGQVDLDWTPLDAHAVDVFAPDVHFGELPPAPARVMPFRGASLADPMIISMARFAEMLRARPEYQRWLRSLLQQGSVVYVGVAPRTLVSLLSAIEVSAEPASPHVAFVDRGRVSSEADLELLRWKFNVQPVLHDGDEFKEIVESLTTAGASRAPSLATPRVAPPVVRSLSLKNISVHRDLTLTLSPSWNVLLGNNATGKSSILRALALAMLGENVRAHRAAKILLRADESAGSIAVETQSDAAMTFTTTLVRESNGVRPIARQRTPLEERRLLVLGFPAVRGVSSRELTGPVAIESGPPSPADVLPLVLGEIDPRIDDVRQWVVNRWVRDTAVRAGDHADRTGDIQRFFATLSALTPGTPWSFAKVDPDRWEVLVQTADGVVPLERMSQGIISIIGWIGTLLYRLFDAFPESEDPAREHALVLIDEIDAHLHPEWQRKLVPLMKEHFPNLQVIAATHSPLIVSSLSRDEVKVLERRDGAVVLREISEDPALLRVDQVLTSDAFGLETTLSERAVKLRDEHAAIAAKSRSKRSPEEQARLDEIESVWPSSFESAQERDESESLFQRIAERLAEKDRAAATRGPGSKSGL